MKRVFLIVLDSFGIGSLPDAYLFGDEGANTLKSNTGSPFFKISNLISLGLGNIDGVDCIKKDKNPIAAYGRCAEKSMGKDTTVGHWEIAGLISEKPLPTYPQGFPSEVISKFEALCGRRVICNLPYSGTKVIEDYGQEHLDTGALIVYTSADSVFQIAAHEDVVPVNELYRYCELAREMLVGEHGVGRVIARPFTTENLKFVRTASRRDFSLKPRGKTVLNALCEQGLDVIAVGKINDIFAGEGITRHIPTHSNREGIDATLQLLNEGFCGLAFINLVDFDMLYGHRNDIDGYAKALSDLDGYLPSILSSLKDDDTLIITADHGCDPGDVSTDHTREYVPLLIVGKDAKGVNLGTFSTYAVIGDYVAELLGAEHKICAESIDEILKKARECE